MPSAKIRIDQPANAEPIGVAGRARDDIVAGAVVNLRNDNNTGVTTYFWSLVDKPPGSSTSISNPLASVASMTPDVAGTYRVYLRVNNGRDRKGMEDYTTVIVRDAAGFRKPAYLEGVESDFLLSPGVYNEVGWLHETRLRMHADDNRAGSGQELTIGGGLFDSYAIEWPLKDAVLTHLEFTSTSVASARVWVAPDAAFAYGYDSGLVDPSSTFIYKVHTTITRPNAAGLESGRIYFKVLNNGGFSDDFVVKWRLQAL